MWFSYILEEVMGLKGFWWGWGDWGLRRLDEMIEQ